MFRIPKDRIAVIIGTDGRGKQRIEEITGTSIEIDSQTGTVMIEKKKESLDSIGDWIAQNIIKAIARGFNPKIAEKLVEDEYILEIIDLERIVGKNKKALQRTKARIIGKDGVTWKTIENLAEVHIAVYGRTIAMIGQFEEMKIARESINKLLTGQNHSTVYKFLQKKHEELKQKRMRELWRPAPDF